MTKTEALARIDAELARLAALTPTERARLDRLLVASDAMRTQDALLARVLGK